MLDPAELYRFETDGAGADRSASTLVVALAGFVDAGGVQQLVVDHLLARCDHRVVATFDVDQLIDFRGRRPSMTFQADHWSEYADPTLVLYRLLDDEGTPFLLLHGFEPDYQWERTVEAIRRLGAGLGVDLTVGVHGIPMAVPHTRPTHASFHGTSAERRAQHRPLFGTVSVPGSLAGLLELRLGEAGHDALTFSVHVPHYLAQSEFVPAAVYGLEQLLGVTGLVVDDAALQEAAAETLKVVRTELDTSTEAAEVVAALERQYDTRVAARANLLDSADAPLPTADQLGEEFEAFLRGRDEGEKGR